MIQLYDAQQVRKRIIDIMPLIIDEFVVLYGEKFRNVIEQRIADTQIYICTPPSYVKFTINNELKQLNNNLLNSFFKDSGMDTSSEESSELAKKILLEDNIDFSSTMCNIDWFPEWEDDIFKFVPQFLKSQSEVLQAFGINISEENYDEVIQSEEVKKIMPCIQALYNTRKKYREIVSKKKSEVEPFLSKAIHEISEIEEFKEVFEKLFLEEVIKLYPERIKDKNNMKIEYGKEGYSYCWGIETPGTIIAFSQEWVRKLNSNEIDDMRKAVIRGRQIAYLTTKGIDIDYNNYDEVINSEECKSAIPSYEEVEKIENLREDFLNSFYECIVNQIPSYREVYDIYKGISPKELIEKFDTYLGCCSNSLVDGKLEKTVVISPFGFDDYLDVMIIHELVHAIEVCIDSKGNIAVGFAPINEHVSINEVKTQMIAIEVTKSLHEKGIFLLDNPATSKLTGKVTYEKNIPVLEEFMCKFKKIILEVGITGDFDSFFDKVGKKNFEKLSKIVDEHNGISDTELSSAIENNEHLHPVLCKQKQLIRTANELVYKMEQKAFGTSHNGR